MRSWDVVEDNEVGYEFLMKIAIQAAYGMAFLESKKVTNNTFKSFK